MEARVTLPDAETILACLRSVMDEKHPTANLYPRITQYAGETRTPGGIEVMVALAIEDYTHGYPPPVKNALYVALPDFVAALIGVSADG